MVNDDVDDVFKDFEIKVEDNKETSKERPDEEEHLKRKYQEAEETLREKHRKEKEALEEKRRKETLESGKIPSKKIPNLERIVYISIILLLVAYTFIDMPFSSEKNAGVETDQPITAAVIKEENKSDEVKEEVIEEKIVQEVKEAAKEEKELSGVISLIIEKIYTEVVDEEDDFGYINNIIFTISNGKNKVLTPVVNVYAYDNTMDESWETRSRGEYTYNMGISPGKNHTGSINLVPKTWKNLDLKKNIRLVLNSTEDGFITAVNQKVLIS
ncbi:MAG: hypothetical protein V1831_02205 [Candidatus Woesearchaeota archaeon]